ncbi:MAG: aryl-sulfate sulfotransferase [Bacteroidota bacterium]|nr:aryl-sulfate sulfotransferase [Bacteroidota bacterium]
MIKRYTLFISLLVFVLIGCQKEDAPSPQAPEIIAENFVISPDSILVNPYGYAPLTALVKFSHPQAGKTKMVVKGKNGVNSDIVQQFEDLGLSHSIPILGLYADYENTVEISLLNDSGRTLAHSTITIKTDPLPPTLPHSIEVTTAQLDKMENGLNLVSNFSRFYTGVALVPLMVDNFGDIRWLLDYSKH